MTLQRDCAIWLYGSYARGDSDAMSDVDVLAVSDHTVQTADVVRIIGNRPHLTVTQYSWSELKAMSGYGSLFLHHVAREGVPLAEGAGAQGRLTNTLANLPTYGFAMRDCQAFQVVLSDIRLSLISDSHLAFELITTGTLIRHAAILGCALNNQPCFARYEPLSRVVRDWALPQVWSAEFPSLYSYRIHSDRGLGRVPSPSRALAEEWCTRAEVLLEKLEERANGCN